MPPIPGGQINAVGFIIRGDNDAADVEDVIFAQVLLIDPQNLRR